MRNHSSPHHSVCLKWISFSPGLIPITSCYGTPVSMNPGRDLHGQTEESLIWVNNHISASIQSHLKSLQTTKHYEINCKKLVKPIIFITSAFLVTSQHSFLPTKEINTNSCPCADSAQLIFLMAVGKAEKRRKRLYTVTVDHHRRASHKYALSTVEITVTPYSSIIFYYWSQKQKPTDVLGRC